VSGRRGSAGGSGIGTLFFVIGCASILGVTFVVGALTAMYWRPSRPVVAAAAATPAAPAPTSRRTVDAPPERAQPPAAPAPTLTFYHELTAPLTPPAPPPAPVPRPRTAAPGPAVAPPTVPAATSPAAPTAGRSTPAAEGGFTVQVASYRTRQAADSLRQSLVSSGYDAYLVESATADGVRYRVRVGTFPTRQAASAAAAKLTSQRPLAAYVTPR
jgi:cell division protein FtsN